MAITLLTTECVKDFFMDKMNYSTIVEYGSHRKDGMDVTKFVEIRLCIKNKLVSVVLCFVYFYIRTDFGTTLFLFLFPFYFLGCISSLIIYNSLSLSLPSFILHSFIRGGGWPLAVFRRAFQPTSSAEA